jgi:hypothetical protein
MKAIECGALDSYRIAYTPSGKLAGSPRGRLRVHSNCATSAGSRVGLRRAPNESRRTTTRKVQTDAGDSDDRSCKLCIHTGVHCCNARGTQMIEGRRVNARRTV